MTTKTKTLITSLAICGGILLGAGTAEADATYTVKSGDTLSGIAESTGQSVSDLAQKNGISDINRLSVGQVIEIDDTSENETYTVKSGDTLSGIAEKYGTTVDRLMQLNHLSSDFLVVGEQIVTVGFQATAQTVQTQPQLTTANSAQVAQNSSQTVQTQPQSTTTNSAQNSSQTYTQAQNSQNVQSADQQTSTYYNSSVSESEQAAKEWIAQRESHGSYSARNGQYVGKYQLSADKLNGDMTPANQERTADNYVKQRYGSWAQAKQAWLQNGLY